MSFLNSPEIQRPHGLAQLELTSRDAAYKRLRTSEGQRSVLHSQSRSGSYGPGRNAEHAESQSTAEGLLRESIDDSPDSIDEPRLVEVHYQTESYVPQPQIGQELLLVDSADLLLLAQLMIPSEISFSSIHFHTLRYSAPLRPLRFASRCRSPTRH